MPAARHTTPSWVSVGAFDCWNAVGKNAYCDSTSRVLFLADGSPSASHTRTIIIVYLVYDAAPFLRAREIEDYRGT